MIIPILVNVDDIYSQFDISEKEVGDVLDYVVKEITASYANMWREEAELGLGSTRERYVSNLNVVDEGRMSGAVVLDYTKDKMVSMIEEGASAFDMKEGFSKSDKRIAKDDGGWYLTVPFKLSTPSSSGSSIKSSNRIPDEIYSQVKKLDSNKSLSIKNLDSIPSQYKVPSVRPAFSSIPTSKSFDEYVNKASKYEGITKITDATTGQNSYMTFRRVSDKSDPNSFIHPGLDARNFAQKALTSYEQNAGSEISKALNKALNFLGF